jgi:DNA end-binding protein Ku
MARPLWTGTLGFGLVSIPVQVFSAVKDLGPHFHFLRKGDKSRIHYQKIAAADEKPVSQEELVKGYEYSKGRYVVLTSKDFEAAAVKRDSRIELLDFVEPDEVDDRYFNKPYYLLPGAGGDKAYALLRAALKREARIGIAKVVMRNKPHLAAVEVIKDALVLSTMRFREELIPISDYEFPDVSVREAEVRLAQQLVQGLAAKWDPDKYTDEYRANLLKIIQAKQDREKPDLEVQSVEADSKVIDLMERLRRSLGHAAGPKGVVKKKSGRRAPAKPRASTRAKTGRAPTTRRASSRRTPAARTRRAA